MTIESEALKLWHEHCSRVQAATAFHVDETPADKSARIQRARSDYNFFVQYYFPHYAKCECADFQIRAARKIKSDKNIKALFKWARGHAKSTHLDIFVPLWLKIQAPKELNVMVLVSKSDDAACTLLSDIQAELEYNQLYISDFGEQKSVGSWTDGEFITQDGCAFFARGRGQSPRGLRYREYRPDYIVIDDIDDDEIIENERRVKKAHRWMIEALFGTLDGGRGRFIMVGNLIGKMSIMSLYEKQKNVYVDQVNILDKSGSVSWSQKWTRKEVQDIEDFVGYRAFQKEYMNNPITDGAVFHNDWIRYKKMLPIEKYEKLVLYIDPSFKSSRQNDYKAAKLWGSTGRELHCIEAFCRQCSISEMVRWVYDLYERYREKAAISYYMEANFLQDIILDEFALEGDIRGYQLPILPDKRSKPDKFARIEAISPLWERGFTYYNIDKEKSKDMIVSIDQTLCFEKGSSAHDDSPDADEGAIWMLQRSARATLERVSLGSRPRPKGYY